MHIVVDIIIIIIFCNLHIIFITLNNFLRFLTSSVSVIDFWRFLRPPLWISFKLYEFGKIFCSPPPPPEYLQQHLHTSLCKHLPTSWILHYHRRHLQRKLPLHHFPIIIHCLPYFATCGLVCFLAVTQCAWVPLVCVRLFCHWQCCASASGRVTLLPHTLAYINFFLILWPLTCNTIIHLAIHWSFLYNNNISVTRVSEGMRGGCFTT